ncbi:MAG: hypothetical protein ACPIA2_13610 [Mariniblastus sp.]
MTRTFCCQIQLDRLTFMTEDDVMQICAKIADAWDEDVEIQTGNDNGKYVNLLVESNDSQSTWERIKWPFIESKIPGGEFANAIILTATGDHGWDDYLLLHHYDSNEKPRTLPEIAG